MPNDHWVDILRKEIPHISTSFITWEDVSPFAIWAIRKNRNENNVNNNNLNINTTKVFQQTLEYHFFTSKPTTSSIHIKVKVKWHPPPRKWYKFNFDGAFNNDYMHGGISGITRNNKGKWMLGYYEKCQIISPIHAELLALWQALQTIIKEKITPCELETDATEVLNRKGNGAGGDHNEAQLP
ncbi:PREDICTED: uncharacterized protein LOC109216686 [Nicotiana attenuata]|uniref:uncharacterized protein LOC109216686 n=1 Tax=Nicotiana attenuata TaxID=49451 RepID=UPI000904BB7F|nr:PREDICTED: uncharacterized protein LOC109216686 [Nicotiana attenuata]